MGKNAKSRVFSSRSGKASSRAKALRDASVAAARAIVKMGPVRSLGGRSSVGDHTTAIFHNLAARVRNAGTDTAPSWQAQIGAITFKLSDMPNYAQYTGMYDAFRIKRAVVRFINGTTSGNYTALRTQSCPQLFVVNDYDDNALQSTFAQDILADSRTKHVQLLTEYSHPIVPRAALRTYNDSNLTQTGYAEAKPYQWIDTDYPDVPHYCVKYSVPTAMGTGSDGGVLSPYAEINVWVEMEVEFKNKKL